MYNGAHIYLSQRSWKDLNGTMYVRSLADCFYSCLEINKASLLLVCKRGFNGQWVMHRELVH